MNAPTRAEAPAWAIPTAEAAEDLDEPPEIRLHHPSPHKFQRTAIRQPSAQSSLLTKAIMGQSDDDLPDHTTSILIESQRRRSMASNVSVASTADLTSDTGLTSPCRTNTPSPPIPEMIALCLNPELSEVKRATFGAATAPEVAKDPPRKRCIQFACAANPQQDVSTTRPVAATRGASAQEPRRPCIKFACPSGPLPVKKTVTESSQHPITANSAVCKSDSSSTPKKPALAAAVASPQPVPPRMPSSKTTLSRPKFLRADSKDLCKDSSQFHEFASGTTREDEWIRQGEPAVANKITIYDTLTKENTIRRLGAEVEEEAALEEEEAEAALDEDDEDECDGDDDEDDEDDEGEGGHDSDGYYTDEETGFAASDEDDDEDENMMLWTPSNATNRRSSSMVAARRPSLNEPLSDSSAVTTGSMRRTRTKRVKIPSDTPDLPDSTDFVCGTLDEDRPLEEAYLSCLAARRNGKLRVIPQDIDPSFPASEPDNDDEEDLYNPVAHESDSDVMVHGEMEDLHHGQDRARRRRRNEHPSPRKYRSPAPKRHHSPPPKARNRSPKTLFGGQSPRRAKSPAPRALTTPVGSPRHGAHVQFHLAGRPNTTHTKSLPRPAALFPHLKKERTSKYYHHGSDVHVRGAIDIVKGLERKRQRRKEKFYQKYCNRARRGQIPERKPQPGRGAERMKELGLLMAGKKDQGNYVLSV
ncbi:hypothetical protein HIM_07723 [Hirsutella minnesotensis 3608]|uniref:Uncharacterized protein n=1 Tax=Hirsutella minnesotensis 3608 TaxID=1043627 RepID=A0A0F7ZN15_9HYPO|nr:hypothetical protein HIM_07723 [Hirsutella minnesotensis 3608]